MPRLRRLTLLAALLAGVGPAGPADALASGAVGHVVTQIAVAGAAPGEARQVDVHLWYPADAQDASERPKTAESHSGKSFPQG